MDIEPCWWCGSAAIALQSSYRGNDRHWVECYETRTCGSRGPDRITRAEAIAAWNRVAGQRWRPIETAPRDGSLLTLARFNGPEMIWTTQAEWGVQDLGYIQKASWSGWFVQTPFIVQDPMKQRRNSLYGTLVEDARHDDGPTHWRPALEPPEGDTP